MAVHICHVLEKKRVRMEIRLGGRLVGRIEKRIESHISFPAGGSLKGKGRAEKNAWL